LAGPSRPIAELCSEIVDDQALGDSCEIEAVEVYHLGPRRHEVFHKLLLRVRAGIDFREDAELRVNRREMLS